VMAILDDVDPERTRAERGELCVGTVDSWVAWTLSGGGRAGADTLHVTDATNAAVTALVDPRTIDWDAELLKRLRIPAAMLPTIPVERALVGVGLCWHADQCRCHARGIARLPTLSRHFSESVKFARRP
jgi:glycerol kinase